MSPSHLSLAAILLSLCYVTTAKAETYAVQFNVTFDMSQAKSYAGEPLTAIWGVPVTSGSYTVTSSFKFDTAGAILVAAGDFSDGSQPPREFNWYGIPIENVKNFSVQFGDKTWGISNLTNLNLQTPDGASVEKPLWYSPNAGTVAFDAWDISPTGSYSNYYANAFTFSESEGGGGYGIKNAFVYERANGVLGSITSLVITPVPEPEPYAMLLAGLGLIGGIAGRQKKK